MCEHRVGTGTVAAGDSTGAFEDSADDYYDEEEADDATIFDYSQDPCWACIEEHAAAPAEPSPKGVEMAVMALKDVCEPMCNDPYGAYHVS